MKNLLLLLALLLSFGAAAQGVLAEAPFKKANVIIIQTTDSASVAYRNIGRLLLSQGYTIAQSDKDFGSVTTSEQKGIRGTKHVLTALVTPIKGGSQIAVSGTFSDYLTAAALGAPSAPTELVIENVGAKTSPAQAAWSAMEKAARAYPGGQLRYSAKN